MFRGKAEQAGHCNRTALSLKNKQVPIRDGKSADFAESPFSVFHNLVFVPTIERRFLEKPSFEREFVGNLLAE